MKKFFVLMFVTVLFSVSFSGGINELYKTIQPSVAYRCSTALFNNADSAFYTTIYTGAQYVSNWIMVAPGITDSCIIFVHPANNTDTTVRFPIKIRTNETGIPIPMIFDRIWKIGTDVSVDSIWYGPFLRFGDE